MKFCCTTSGILRITQGEHLKTGGIDNLCRATYAVYNGGPSQLSRYRLPDTKQSLKKIDTAWWQKYQAVSAGRELEVAGCYEDNRLLKNTHLLRYAILRHCDVRESTPHSSGFRAPCIWMFLTSLCMIFLHNLIVSCRAYDISSR